MKEEAPHFAAPLVRYFLSVYRSFTYSFPLFLWWQILTALSEFDHAYRTFFGAFAASGTLLIIDMRYTVFNVYRIRFTLFFTQLAGKTACRTDLFDRSPAVVAGAAHCIGRLVRNELDQMFRAYGNAFSAGAAQRAVDGGYTVFHSDRFKGADCCAGAKAQAAIVAGPRG